MKKRIILLVLLCIYILAFPTTALAQDYSFGLDNEVVHVFWNDDGTLSLIYTLVFSNDPSAHIIDFVDLGLPNSYFNESNIQAEINGNPVDYISSSEYQGSGSGVAIALGNHSIPQGGTGTVIAWIPEIKNMLFIEDTDDTYASAVFSPNTFGSQYVNGATDLTVIYHLPPGIQPDEPRWHKSPSGFPEEPETGYDQDGRITYTWNNQTANGHTKYKFGASFPAIYVPVETITKPTVYDRTGIDEDTIMGFLCCGSVGGFIIFLAWIGISSERRRKMKYLPPKIRIEGQGIKRGLTAVEAAILMEQPMDKVLTMILFSVIKKDAASVILKDPLKLNVVDSYPDSLRSYETKFLNAFMEKIAKARKKELQSLMVDLIKSVGSKMKGFSHKETVAYYKVIMERAWQQVETADTPEVKSQKFDEHMGWTMLDKNFDDRTQDVFRSGPVYVPMWWGRYDPGWARTSQTAPNVAGSPRAGKAASPSLPNLPGGEFAASVVTGIQGFSSDVVGNITEFTSGITNKTNPVPKTTSRSSGGFRSGGSSSCACACACAGCACACAGGGR